MCDASDYAIGAVLGQRLDKHIYPNYYASKMLNDAQGNYTTTEKELLAAVYAFDKFRSYLLLSKTIVLPIIPRAFSLPKEIREASSYTVDSSAFRGMTTQQKKKFFRDVNQYVWDDLFLFKIGGDRILRRCVTREEGLDILKHYHEGLIGGHHGAHATDQKVFDCGFYWPTVVKGAMEFVRCVMRAKEQWVEAQALATNDAWVVVKFLKKLFTHFGTLRAIISDRGTHFFNTVMEKALARYGVTQRTSTTYHPQTNGQVENSNRGVKIILEKTVGVSHMDWSEKLDDALWAL
ncbi:uncharacterized protein LOC143588193 [Bidens hawaiensis]|uniref:uncharacterized protein LOC143588193 n=1 Tax=Bidens hawaiensis TaxID=980011 RepID=UPI0040499F0A